VHQVKPTCRRAGWSAGRMTGSQPGLRRNTRRRGAGLIAVICWGLAGLVPTAASTTGRASRSDPPTSQTGERRAAEVSLGPATLFAQYQPWQPQLEPLDGEGYPPDRRLLSPVSISRSSVTIAEALAEAVQQTKVDLSAVEVGLRNQRVTLYARALPLEAVMVQLAQLLGLYWYYRTDDGVRTYVVTYGSSPPSVAGQHVLAEQQTHWRDLRAARIADAMKAADLSDADLRKLGEDDPALAGIMLKYPATRYVVRALAALPPQQIRDLVNRGRITVGSADLPPWFEQGLRDDYQVEDWRHLGIETADSLVSRCQLVFESENCNFGPEHGFTYDIWGPMWAGMFCRPVVLPASGTGENQKPVVLAFLPFTRERERLGPGAWLPGRLEDRKRAQTISPELFASSDTRSPPERMAALVAAADEKRKAAVGSSPWKDEPKLSQKPSFRIAAGMTTTDLLAAVATQTGYAVLGTSYEEHVGTVPSEASRDEPIYVLLNRTAMVTKCSWALAGRIIRWRHNDWFIYEASAVPATRE